MCRSLNDPCGGRRCQPKNNPTPKTSKLAEETLNKHLKTPTPPHQQVSETQELDFTDLSTKEAIQTWKLMKESGYYSDATLEKGLTTIGEKLETRVEELQEQKEEKLYEELDKQMEQVYEKEEAIELLKHQLITASPNEAENLNQQLVTLENMGDEEEEILKIEQQLQEKILQLRKEIYIQVLQEIRELGAPLSKIQFNETTQKYEQNLKDTVFAHYPTEWLKHHTDDEDIHIVEDTESFYADSFPNPDGTDMKVVKNHQTIKLVDENENDVEGVRLRQLFKEKIASKYEGVQGTTNPLSHFYAIEVDDEEFDPQIHGSNPDPEEGWEHRESFLTFLKNPPRSNEDFEKAANEKIWVRRITETLPHRKEMHLLKEEEHELNGIEGEKFDAVLYHEFGHRFEDVLPESILPRMEKAFLQRRAGKTDSTMHTSMLKDVLSDSYYHNGRFVNKYVGRDYLTGSSYEVFATGVEAVYGKEYGGLIGQGDFNPDQDHLRFTLGALATL